MDSRSESKLVRVTGNSSYSISSRGEYEVFLSFSGTDTRKGFTDFLYTYLIDANIRTFRDDNELHVGEDIGGELLKAIKESKISIPVFSKSYASSKWCLRELLQMVECHTNKGQMIYPIFYDVTPFEVKNQTGCYKEAFCLHEKNFDETTVHEWKEAMKKVGKLKGLELLKETNGHEGQLVKKVVREVLLVLKKNYTHIDDNLVGMVDHVEVMNKLLDLDSNGIRVIGIHGMGGLGKTTIAKVIYNQVCDQFQYCCFLEDIREKSVHQNGIVDLQKQLLCKIRKGGASNIGNADEGIAEIKDAIGMKKVIIVLDDVDDKYQLDKLVGECPSFGAGSRILITTRNKEVLDTLEARYQTKNLSDVYRSYEPHLLTFDDSLKLFSRNAFMRDFPLEDFVILAEKVVTSAGGLPLVLVTVGSLLFGKKDISLWKEKLRKLEEIPHEKVMERLRISYNALEYTQKQIFLDIACFFIGHHCTNPCYMWEACAFYPDDGLNALVLRHMIKIGDDKKFTMHDHLRDLGRQIVREENMTEQGERSRLWSSMDAMDLLERSMLTTKVQALDLDLDQCITDRMRRLFETCFAELQYFLEPGELSRLWSGKDVVDLLNRRRTVTKKVAVNIWDDCVELQNLSKNAWDLERQIEKLQALHTESSQSRRFIGDDFVQLRNLRFLKLGCGDLDGNFKRCLSNLKWLTWICPGKISPINLYLKNLTVLDLRESNMTDDWKGWSEIKMARSLKSLNLCSGLNRGPDFSNFTNLEKLHLNGCRELEDVNPSIRCLINLKYLSIAKCVKLRTFDCSPLSALEILDLSDCVSLQSLDCFEPLESLRGLYMRNCERLRTLPNLSNLKKLEELQLRDCYELIEIQNLDMLECLEFLLLRGSAWLERLPNLSHLRMLKTLHLPHCLKLLEVDGLESLESLEDLDMSGCISIEKLPDFSNLGKLKRLRLYGCKKLCEVKGLKALKSLEVLYLSYCNVSLEEDDNDFSNLTNLEYLDICGVENLVEIPGLEELKSLEVLVISDCRSIRQLPDLSNHEKLREIHAYGCTKLTNISTSRACEVYGPSSDGLYQDSNLSKRKYMIEIKRPVESNHEAPELYRNFYLSNRKKTNLKIQSPSSPVVPKFLPFKN